MRLVVPDDDLLAAELAGEGDAAVVVDLGDVLDDEPLRPERVAFVERNLASAREERGSTKERKETESPLIRTSATPGDEALVLVRATFCKI